MDNIVSVFGSSRPAPGSNAYEEARRVGYLLAREGFTVATGGYQGTMAAASQGASEGGGHVIGVTSRHMDERRPAGRNQWVREEITYPTLRERLLHLVMNNAGMIALPGGIGTLSEMTMAWSLMQVDEIEVRPLVLMGALWPQMLRDFLATDHVIPRDAGLLDFAPGPDEAVAIIVARCRP